ncbi:Uncharacterized protein APZ42_000809, partial [Daphnia magna]
DCGNFATTSTQGRIGTQEVKHLLSTVLPFSCKVGLLLDPVDKRCDAFPCPKYPAPHRGVTERQGCR